MYQLGHGNFFRTSPIDITNTVNVEETRNVYVDQN